MPGDWSNDCIGRTKLELKSSKDGTHDDENDDDDDATVNSASEHEEARTASH